MNLEKFELLKNHLQLIAEKDCCLAFSGGIDSSLLLKLLTDAAKINGTTIYAVTFDTVLHPRQDLEVAKQVAQEMGAIHHIIFVDELNTAGILNNPKDRCYRCKKSLFQHLMTFAEEKQAAILLEGTNADDLLVYRPGIQAVQELGINSPLADLGITKQEVREFAEHLHISVSNRPSTPCMATRIPYRDSLSLELLQKIEASEAYLKTFGFYNVRVRIHGNMVRLEVDVDAFQKLLTHREEIITFFHSQGFPYVNLDLEGFRSGSMDIF